MPTDLGTFSQDVFAYDGDDENLTWGRDTKGMQLTLSVHTRY
jgi:hypothetical protein